MAFINTAGNSEPIQPSGGSGNGALDLSVSSPRRAPSAEQSPQSRNSIHSPALSICLSEALLPEPTGTTGNHSSSQPLDARHSLPSQALCSAAHPFTAMTAPPIIPRSISGREMTNSSRTDMSAFTSSLSKTVDLNKLRSVHHIMQNQTQSSAKSIDKSHYLDCNRPKMTLPVQNRTSSHSTQQPGLQPRPHLKPQIRTAGNTASSDLVAGHSSYSSSSSSNIPSASNSTHQLKTTHSDTAPLISSNFVKLPGVINWNGPPVQLMTGVRLPGSHKMQPITTSGSAQQIAATVTSAPQLPVAPRQLVQTGMSSKSMGKHRDMPTILPAPNNTTQSTNGSSTTLSIQQARTNFQRAIRASDVLESAASAVKGGQLPPVTQARYSQSHRPIMPKPSKQPAPTQSSPPVIYFCTLPSAPPTTTNVVPQPARTASTTNTSESSQSQPDTNGIDAASSQPPPIADASSSSPPAIKLNSSPVKKSPVSKLKSPIKEVSPTKEIKRGRSHGGDEPVRKKVKESPLASKKEAVVDETAIGNNSMNLKAENGKKAVVPKPKTKLKRKFLTHIIDGFVILESDRPFNSKEEEGNSSSGEEKDEEGSVVEDDGKESNENEQSDDKQASKRRRRQSSTASSSVVSESVTPSEATTADTGVSEQCFQCKRQIPCGSKVRRFKGKPLCDFRCYSEIRHKHAINRYRKDNSSPSKPGKSASPAKISPEPSKKNISPTKAAGAVISSVMPSFLMSPGPLPARASGTPMTPLSNAASSKPPSQWSVAEVNDFIKAIPGCEEAAQKFLDQEIDGPALLLLKSDVMLQFMGIKIGPVLKITNKISSLGGGGGGGGGSASARDSVGSSPPSASRPAVVPQPKGSSSTTGQQTTTTTASQPQHHHLSSDAAAVPEVPNSKNPAKPSAS